MTFSVVLAVLKLASPFTDGAILQRDRMVPVWGWADPGEKVTVSFAGQSVSATAKASGKWRVDLAPMSASKKGQALTVTSCNPTIKQSNNQAILHDVLVGEVWICSGQSNMEFPVCGRHPHLSERLGATIAEMTRLDCVRFARTPYVKVYSTTPKAETGTPVVWKRFTRENLSASMAFSAVGAYYALEIYHALDSQVPVGIIGVYEGGTPIDAWTPQPGECKDLGNCCSPGVLFNELVNPWCPYALRGMIWYQGCYEASVWQTYTEKMHRLYGGWAAKFEQPDLPFFFVQLAPWWDRNVPHLQEAQAKFAAEEPRAGMAVANDLGNPHDIHPYEKLPVAKRLALHALKRIYGYDDIEADSPVLRSWKVEDGAFHLAFDHAKKLHLYNADFSVSNGFEVAGADGRFVPARIDNLVLETNAWKRLEYRGALKGEGLVIRADGVPDPKHLRYLHSSPWRGNVYNEANLPLGVFHIDVEEDWQAAIDAAAAAGGGEVRVPAGRHETGTLYLKSGVTLRLEKDAVLCGSRRIADYPDVRIEYAELREPWQALIVADGQTNVAVVGEGTVDGNGASFPYDTRLGRPCGLIFHRCRNVWLEGVTLREPARWTCYLKECDGVTVRGVKVDSHANGNNDGIDIDSRNVLVEDCVFDSDDDAIVLKCDNPDFCVENVEIRNCEARSCCSTIKFGTGSHGGFRHVRIHDIVCDASARCLRSPRTGRVELSEYRVNCWPGSVRDPAPISGIAIESVDGAGIDDIVIRNVDIRRATVPIFIRGGLRTKRLWGDQELGIPLGCGRFIRNVTIENVKAHQVSYTANSITGIPDLRLANIVLRNVEISVPGAGEAGRRELGRPVPEKADRFPESNMFDSRMLPAYGFYVRHADDVVFDNVTVTVRGEEIRPEIVTDDVTGFRRLP